MQMAQEKVIARAIRGAMQRDDGYVTGGRITDGEPGAARVDDHAAPETLARENRVAQLRSDLT